MKELQKKLNIHEREEKGLFNRENFNGEFKEIAEDLFQKCCIKCGDKTFRFAEIEFYYYSSQNFSEDWNKITYPREKQAGEFFFHYSGVDICFQSKFAEKDQESAYYGGILIRSVIEVDDKNRVRSVEAGPLYVANLLLNSCSDAMPILEVAAHEVKLDLKTIHRFGVNLEKEGGHELCYYIDNYNGEDLNWKKTSERQSWDMNRLCLKSSRRNYKKDRFKEVLNKQTDGQ